MLSADDPKQNTVKTEKKGLLENALSLRTSAHAGVVPQGYFLRAQSPGFSNILVVKAKLFPFNRGTATPL